MLCANRAIAGVTSRWSRCAVSRYRKGFLSLADPTAFAPVTTERIRTTRRLDRPTPGVVRRPSAAW
jgi:hypothetical protein